MQDLVLIALFAAASAGCLYMALAAALAPPAAHPERQTGRAELSIDGHFLPGVLVGSRFSLSRPCLGSTIALHRNSLVAIGGFEAIADCLADDYEIGSLLAERGEPVSLLQFAVGHVCDER